MKKKIRIAVSGCMGRMGKMLVKEIEKNKNTRLTVALVKPSDPSIHKDIGESIGIGKIGVLATDTLNPKKSDFDILIDFTKPSATLQYLEYCNHWNKKIIIGTTGFSQKEIKKLELYSNNISIMLSANFSIGINLILQLIKKMTKIIGNNSDIDIIEFHHRKKADAPSGTALTIGQTIAKSMNWDLKNHSTYLKKGIIGARKDKTIGFASIRTGNIIGKHIIMFSGLNETIELTHTATSRMSFAAGAVQSAIWIKNKEPGLFNMNDMLLI